MPKITSDKRGKVIALDGDKLGHIAGAAVALVVMSLSFFYQEVDGVTAFVRTGWAFVFGYGATFFLVRVILKKTLALMIENKRVALEEKRARLREQRVEDQASNMAAAEEARQPQEDA